MIYHNDNKIKFEYNQVISGDLNPLNAVGVTDSATLRSLGFTPSDTNAIFVSKTGNDTTALGTESDPVLTIEHANDLVTSTKSHIVILDSGMYEEPYIDFSSDLTGIYAALGETPKITPSNTYNSTNYTVDKMVETARIDVTVQRYNEYTEAIMPLDDGSFVILYATDNGSCMRKIDSDGNIIGGEYTVSSNTSITWGCSFGDFFVIAYQNNLNDTLYIKAYNQDMSSKWTKTYGFTGACAAVGAFGDAGIIAVADNGSISQFVVVDYDGEEVLGKHNLTIRYTHQSQLSIVPYNGGAILAGEGTPLSDPLYVIKINENGVILNSETMGTVKIPRMLINQDGNLVIVILDTDDKLYYRILDPSDLSTIVSNTLYWDSGLYVWLGFAETWDGNLILNGYNYTAEVGFLRVIKSDFSEDLYSTTFTTGKGGQMGGYNPVNDRYCTASHVDIGSTYYPVYATILSGFVWDWWTAFAGDIEFNGLDFDADNIDGLNTVIDTNTSDNSQVKWCTFRNVTRINYNDTAQYPLVLFKSTASANTVANCKVHNNDTGLYFESNNVNISYCQAYKNLRGEGFHIKGAGSSVIINHCDFLYNNKGLKLEDNNGNEIIKNSIFYKNAYYGIEAGTEVDYINSVSVDLMSNAVAGTQVIQSNPHYINDGFITPANMNLNLKRLSLGYNFDSPALDIGDDGENAGSLLVEISGSNETWDSIELYKPTDIGIKYEPVNEYNTEFNDGSLGSGKDSASEVITLKWETVIKADFAKLLSLYTCESSVVRIYFDPTTYPLQYGTYTLVQDTLNAAPKHYKLSRTGVQNVEVQFKRAYDEGS